MRVVIAEDNVLLQEGLNLLLSTAGFEVMAAVDTPDDIMPAMMGSGPTSPSWTSDCRRRSATRGCAPRWPRAG